MMNMKIEIIWRYLLRSLFSAFLLATLLLVGCGDDPEPPNEEELITTLIVTLTPDGGGSTVTMTFKDLDGDGANPPAFTYNPSTGGGNPAAILTANTTYDGSIQVLNEAETPTETITDEIEEEADEHLFCFTKTGLDGLAIAYADTEADYLAGGSSKVVGLATTWTVGDSAGTGTVTITLRHQPGVKTGACPGGGETDIEVTFNVSIQ
jgi:hypothetical protein